MLIFEFHPHKCFYSNSYLSFCNYVFCIIYTMRNRAESQTLLSPLPSEQKQGVACKDNASVSRIRLPSAEREQHCAFEYNTDNINVRNKGSRIVLGFLVIIVQRYTKQNILGRFLGLNILKCLIYYCMNYSTNLAYFPQSGDPEN